MLPYVGEWNHGHGSLSNELGCQLPGERTSLKLAALWYCLNSRKPPNGTRLSTYAARMPTCSLQLGSTENGKLKNRTKQNPEPCRPNIFVHVSLRATSLVGSHIKWPSFLLAPLRSASKPAEPNIVSKGENDPHAGRSSLHKILRL